MLRGGGRGVHVGRGGEALVQFAGTLRARAPHRARPPGAPRAPAGAARRAPAAGAPAGRAPAAPAAGPVHLQHNTRPTCRTPTAPWTVSVTRAITGVCRFIYSYKYI